MAQHNRLEVCVGAVVLSVAVAFAAFGYHALGRLRHDGYMLHAQFTQIDGIDPGSEVRVGGVVVGNVAHTYLDPTTYKAVLDLRMHGDIRLPKDSSAGIVSAGLLGGRYVAISPGADDALLAPEDTILFTQSSLNFEALLGKFLFSSGDRSKSSTPPDTPEASH